MKFQASKQFTVKINGKMKTLHHGKPVDLPEEMIGRLLLAGVVVPTDLEGMELQYSTLLARFWKIDKDPAATTEETRRIIARLDDLYRTLRKAGQRVPVRIPIERHRGQEQQPGLAL